MKELLRAVAGFILIALVAYAYETHVQASGFIPEPIWTNDPAGSIDPELFYTAACESHDSGWWWSTENIDVSLRFIAIYDNGYEYHFMLQDVIDTCTLMEMIGEEDVVLD